MTASAMAPARARAGDFYVWMALLCAAFAFGTFAETYWLQLAAGTFVGGGPLLHLHAGLFSAWTVLLVSQAWLGAQGRLAHHRAWGVAGVSLATAMVCVGLDLALRSVQTLVAHGYGDGALTFFMLPFEGLFLFAVFFAAAVANVARPDWHKRLMLAGTVALLQAGAGRIGFLLATGGGPGARPGLGPPPPPPGIIQGALMVSPILLVGLAYDWRTRGRPHPAYVVGLAAILGGAGLGFWLEAQPVWMSFTRALLSLRT